MAQIQWLDFPISPLPFSNFPQPSALRFQVSGFQLPSPRLPSPNPHKNLSAKPVQEKDKKLTYRPEIDGLRAIAVLAVLFFHTKLGFPGGFIGVDVFFVISGFLITSLIIKDLEEGSFTLVRFWERRARRILPALLVMAVVSTLAGGLLLLPRDFMDLGKSAVFLAAFIANFYYYLGTGYFAGSGEEKPLLHTWSLAVEEQFYFVIPILLLGLFSSPRMRRRRALLLIFGIGFLVSLLISISWVTKHPAASFYLLPSRAWELLMGSLVALLPSNAIPSNRKFREAASYLGLGGILIPCFFYDKHVLFPGVAAIPPCLGTALIIWSNGVGKMHGDLTTLGRLLSLRWIVFIGLISYSLYLWHWPLAAYTNYWSLKPTPPFWKWLIVLSSFILAVLSWKYVETPFRRRLLCPSRKLVFAASTAGLLALFGIGLLIRLQNGLPGRLPASLNSAFAENPSDDLLFIKNLEAEQIVAGDLVPFGAQVEGKGVDVLVWGDSHAMAALPAFDHVGKTSNLVGRAAVCSSRAPLVDWYHEDEKSTKFSEAVLGYISREKIQHVFLVCAWRWYVADPLNETAENIEASKKDPEVNRLQQSIERTVLEIKNRGAEPYIMLMAPGVPYDGPKSVALTRLFDLSQSTFTFRPGQWNSLAGYGTEFLKHLESLGIRLIDPRPAFLDLNKSYYQIESDGVSLYRDNHHLSKAGAEKMLVPAIQIALEKKPKQPPIAVPR
jgi:peptidoglycan/LPS O-acetylase OafA/YrhL